MSGSAAVERAAIQHPPMTVRHAMATVCVLMGAPQSAARCSAPPLEVFDWMQAQWYQSVQHFMPYERSAARKSLGQQDPTAYRVVYALGAIVTQVGRARHDIPADLIHVA